MGRNLSPMLRQELANLDKDADSRRSAMKALKSYVKDLDKKAIPHFLAQVSERKEPGSSSGEYTISLYEVLARVHGRNIIPQIDNIMSTIVNTLTSSAGSFPLHQACSKVVPAIARYGIDPSTPDHEKAKIIDSLCKPLSDIMLGSLDSVSSGAALCLTALVESDNWRFASKEMVNEVCLRVTGALEESLTQTNCHMGLAMALAKHNSLIVEAYARLLIQSGLQILKVGEGNSQKRFSAIQMINFLMKCVDSRSIFSELAMVVDMMERCHSDQMPFVRGAALEALQTAKTIVAEKGSKFENGSSMSSSNFSRRRNLGGVRNNSRSPRFSSPESQTVDSFMGYDSLAESPLSMGQASCNFEYRRPTIRKLWKNENGVVDVSLEDGIYSEVRNCSKAHFEKLRNGELSDAERDCLEAFSGFASPANTLMRSATPSPQRPKSPLNIDNIGIFTTPRKLILSLQDPDDVDSNSEKQTRKMRRSVFREEGWSPTREMNGNVFSHNMNNEVEDNKNSKRPNNATSKNIVRNAQLDSSLSESVSSTDDISAVANSRVTFEGCDGEKNGVQNVGLKRRSLGKASLGLICGLSLILFAAIFSALLIDDGERSFNLVPT
ncbi:ARM repeat superfamily protein [Tasmannia lanceolata]|uniref:ARM repeat superfamily protein n=1 Tax=Tasmannia lanceolata TaxID=3420 RepID=UPI00406377EB